MEYQALGGDASKLAPKDLLEQGLTTLYDSAGVPMELFRGTMNLQGSFSAIRLFEAFH